MKFEKGSKAEIRRKLVRGSIAAPLLMTLRPGVAAAQSATCWSKTALTTDAPQLAENQDELVRVQLQIYSVTVNSDTNSQQGTWEAYENNGQYYTRRAQTDGANTLPAHTPIALFDRVEPISGEFDFALAYVDANGVVIDSFPDPQAPDTKPLLMSCWTSITSTTALR